MDLSSHYISHDIEDKWYAHWESNGYFHSEPDERESFSIVIPPPNVTGVLHMGHMLNNTIQDILIRKARMEGKNACWVPGTDHASIATEAKVVRKLREQGIKKSDLTRTEFLEHAWAWKEEYGGIILEQLKKIGASCDWERTAFTMDEVRSEAVIKVFVELYNRGKLYRGKRMVNWDPEAKTVLSNEEVLYNDEQSNLYYVNYKIEDSEEFLTIATTRPETILGDSAIAVHPDDPRYTHLQGKKAIVPLIDRTIPIIFDDYVDIEFGTGALKITPAHDPNDYEIGKKHDLEVIDVIAEDGSISEEGQLFIGKDRFEARKLIKITLQDAGHLEKIEQYTHSVGRSERTNAVIEPKLSLQWYVDMKSLAKPALESVEKDDIEFFPKNQKNLYRHWMENIRDWCISRQLWWGHRIPAYYLDEHVIVETTPEKALAKAKEMTGNSSLKLSDLKQDEDVLDTWFSSWLWPISVFDGFNSRKELEYYYPTSVLVTGWDIIFLWVARMIMAGYEFEGNMPYKHVYFTGMVRDQKRRKMSKSLGNSPDALKLIRDYGADGVRFGMLSCSPAGGDLLFDEKLCEQGRNFCNKMWNALKLVKSWEIDDAISMSASQKEASLWFESKFNKVLSEVQTQFNEYRLSEALINVYSFVWNDFFSWYLEVFKPQKGSKISMEAHETTISFFERLMLVLQPYMPFITEEIWHLLREREAGDDCMMHQYPSVGTYDAKKIEEFEKVKELVAKIRDARNKNQLKQKDVFPLLIADHDNASLYLDNQGYMEVICKLGFVDSIQVTSESNPEGIPFLAGTNKFYLVANRTVDEGEDKANLAKDLAYMKGFVISVEKKLSNERFVNNAPPAVIERERQKLSDGIAKVKILEESLSKYD